jgi:carbon-monoxide dehydrogenase large subunit
MERILDIAAREAGFDPFVIRQKNIIKREEIPYKVGIPYRDGVPIVYDTGDFAACLDKAIEISEEFSLRSDAPNTQLIGRGVACYVEGTGVGPFESAEIVVKEDGTVIVATGACSQGQSHETVFAQLVATKLGIDPSFVFVKGGDTDETQYGWGTLASRSAVVAGSAINNACEKILTRVRAAVSSLWEVAESDLEFIDGVRVKGSPGQTLSWPQISHEFSPRGLFAHQFGVGLHESDHYSPATVTFANGAHVATVSVDVETGLVTILDYVVVHDCGPLLDEGVVTGQIQGGVAQGIGAALYEELIFDDSGQPLNPNLVEYIIPTLAEIPEIRISHYETISPGNPLGIKGVGEAGTIPVPAAIANAICDALASKGIEILRVPATPKYILGLLAKK